MIADQPLPQDEIIRELKRYRYERDLGVKLKTLGEHVGIHRNTLNAYLNGEFGISEAHRRKLSRAIREIRAGRLKFGRRDRVWQALGKAVEAI